jgi:CheY-like chemotaxis protein
MVAVLEPRHVLLLEDDPVSQEFVVHALSSAGLHVTTRARAVDALVVAHQKRFDLVIADYHLPDYPGSDFVRLLRQSDGYRSVPVILFTGRADELNRQRLCDDLFLLVLAKGCSSVHLLTTVFKCLAAVRCSA